MNLSSFQLFFQPATLLVLDFYAVVVKIFLKLLYSRQDVWIFLNEPRDNLDK